MEVYEPVLDAVAEDKDVFFYTRPEPDPRLRELGRRTAMAFGADRRFVHFEFICLDRAHKGIGEAGDYAVMEVNMRPAGGHDPDMMNYAQSVDVYRIYADMVTADKRLFPVSDERWFCAYAARKDGHDYKRSHAEIMDRYGTSLVMQEEMPEIDWPQMGRYLYMAKFRSEEEMQEFFAFVLGKNA